MTKPEVLNFMKKIKSYYQNFVIEDYVLDEWFNKLKQFNTNDVYKRLDVHLNGEFQKMPPQLHFITKYLKTPSQKAKEEKILIRCGVCNSILELEKNDAHLSRHNSIRYIKCKEHHFQKRFDEKKLFELSDEDFEKFYDKFLEMLYTLAIDYDEKERLEKIIFVR